MQQPIAPILLPETHDLDVMEAFLTVFTLLKVDQELISQCAWLIVEHQRVNVPHLMLGIIRQEWKEASNNLSQRYHLKHETPQLVLIKRRRVVGSWSGEEIEHIELAEALAKSGLPSSEEHCAWNAFRQLSGLHEMEPSGPYWHQTWIKRLEKALEQAALPKQARSQLVNFCSYWSRELGPSWHEVSHDRQAQFFAQGHQIQHDWWCQQVDNLPRST